MSGSIGILPGGYFDQILQGGHVHTSRFKITVGRVGDPGRGTDRTATRPRSQERAIERAEEIARTMSPDMGLGVDGGASAVVGVHRESPRVVLSQS